MLLSKHTGQADGARIRIRDKGHPFVIAVFAGNHGRDRPRLGRVAGWEGTTSRLKVPATIAGIRAFAARQDFQDSRDYPGGYQRL